MSMSYIYIYIKIFCKSTTLLEIYGTMPTLPAGKDELSKQCEFDCDSNFDPSEEFDSNDDPADDPDDATLMLI